MHDSFSLHVVRAYFVRHPGSRYRNDLGAFEMDKNDSRRVMIEARPREGRLLRVGPHEIAGVAVFGRQRARTIGIAVLALMVAAGLFYSPHWLTWAIIAYFIAGVDHPAANNELADIGPGRRALGYVALAILAAIVLPVPA